MEFFNVTLNAVQDIHNPVGFEYLVCLRVALSHLQPDTYQHNFSDTVAKFYSCQENESEIVEHYL